MTKRWAFREWAFTVIGNRVLHFWLGRVAIEVETPTWWRRIGVTVWVRATRHDRWLLQWEWAGRNETPAQGRARAQETIEDINARLGPRTRPTSGP